MCAIAGIDGPPPRHRLSGLEERTPTRAQRGPNLQTFQRGNVREARLFRAAPQRAHNLDRARHSGEGRPCNLKGRKYLPRRRLGETASAETWGRPLDNPQPPMT